MAGIAFFVLMLVAGVMGALLLALVGEFVSSGKGRTGEALLNSRVRWELDRNVYHLIPDLTLPTPGGTTQIDHVIVSRYGIFVIETKAYKGWIFGREQDAKWTQVIYKRKHRFQNPLRQNYKHTKALSDLTGIPHASFKSVVVFVGASSFKTEMPSNVLHLQGVTGYIKEHQTAIIKDEQVTAITAAIREWAGSVSDEQRRGHVKNLLRNRHRVELNSGTPRRVHDAAQGWYNALTGGTGAGSGAARGIRSVVEHGRRREKAHGYQGNRTRPGIHVVADHHFPCRWRDGPLKSCV